MTHRLKRVAIAPFLIATLVAFGLFSVGALGHDAQADALIAAQQSPIHGHGTGGPIPSKVKTSTSPDGGTSWSCDWFGGNVRPWSTNEIVELAYGDCDGTTMSFTDSLQGSWSGCTVPCKSDNTTFNNVTWMEHMTPDWCCVPVNTLVTWHWVVTMTAPAGQEWTSVGDSACQINPDPRTITCDYIGEISPFPIGGTSTPTSTPFPTFAPVPPDCTNVTALYSLFDKPVRTNSLFSLETYGNDDAGQAGAPTFQKLERVSGSWLNQTTLATGGIAKKNIPVLPSSDLVFNDDQIGAVGRGFISASITTEIQFTNGSKCRVVLSAQVDNS